MRAPGWEPLFLHERQWTWQLMECGREEGVGCRGDHHLPPGISGEGVINHQNRERRTWRANVKSWARLVQEQMSARRRQSLTVDCDLVDWELRREVWTGMPTWGPAASLRLCLERWAAAWQQPRQSDGSLASWDLAFSLLHLRGLVVSTQTHSLSSYFPFTTTEEEYSEEYSFQACTLSV